ncbi:hypothetical protein C8R47DRAFT_1324360 [Mycena vitilis]|nr:hypothetical protein C8R47DRAFT_1324360 [Mycena vitilis]
MTRWTRWTPITCSAAITAGGPRQPHRWTRTMEQMHEGKRGPPLPPYRHLNRQTTGDVLPLHRTRTSGVPATRANTEATTETGPLRWRSSLALRGHERRPRFVPLLSWTAVESKSD